MIVGPAATGKSTTVKDYVDRGFVRLNRDTAGGKIAGLVEAAEDNLAGGHSVVLDNTHLTPEERQPFVEVAKRHGADAIARHMLTTIADAQVNACVRMIQAGIDILDPAAIKAANKNNPNAFPPVVQYGHYKKYVVPTVEEGFDEVHPVPFVRRPWPGKNRALFVDLDGTIRTRIVLQAPPDRVAGVRSSLESWSGDAIVGTAEDDPERPYPLVPEEIQILPNRVKTLGKWVKDGYHIIGVSNQSGVHKGLLTAKEAWLLADGTMCWAGLEDAEQDVFVCPHASGAPQCWCRKPMPGMAIWSYHKFDLDPASCMMVGDLTSDRTFAERAGLKYVDAEEFFS